MNSPDPQRATAFKRIIEEFLKQRLDAKLEKLKEENDGNIEKRLSERDRFASQNWLANAAKGIQSIQMATHVVKATHPDPKIRDVTNLFVAADRLCPHSYVGSHVLGSTFEMDVTGDAAALPTFKFLLEEFDGKTLLHFMQQRDPDLLTALSDNAATASEWMEAFATVDLPRCPRPASHTRAKQLYWFTGDDPHDDGHYHLLAPMYSSPLAHRIYRTIQEDRFGDLAKEAREARKSEIYHPTPVREYSELAIQKIGGTKPQIISKLNNERRGDNYLLASLPPVWKTVAVQPVLGVDSVFQHYGRRREVLRLVRLLRDFLASDPPPNKPTRNRIDALVADLLDELLHLAAEVRSLAPGWSGDPACRLNTAERLWLDPAAHSNEGAREGARESVPPALVTDEAAERIAGGFANWLNARLRKPLPMGDAEYLHWRKLALAEIEDDLREAHDE
jgi:CRISPR-associated protein Csy1